MKKIIGQNFLHTHPTTEKMLGVDEEHVIVDKKDFYQILDFFRKNPELLKEVGKNPFS